MTSFGRFIGGVADVSLVVVDRDSPEPLQRVLEQLLDSQPTVEAGDRPDEARDMVYRIADGEISARSPLSTLADAISMVNSDIFITGTRDVTELDRPAVVEGLVDVPFQLWGYPEPAKEKLLLIVISRYIERLSLEHDGGKHRASFQRLSRIVDEQGTDRVYERLAESNTDTHVYGMPDWTPPPELDLTMHGGWGLDFQDTWFVVHVPDDESQQHAALVAIERESQMWDGRWTYDPDRVRAINRRIKTEL